MYDENVFVLCDAHPWMTFDEAWLLLKWSYEKNKSQETKKGVQLTYSVDSEVDKDENQSVSSFDKEKICESFEVFETTSKPLTTSNSSSEGIVIHKLFYN